MDFFCRIAALPTVQSMHMYAAHLEQSLRVVALLQVVQLLAYEVAAQHRRSIVEVEEGCCSNKNKHRLGAPDCLYLAWRLHKGRLRRGAACGIGMNKRLSRRLKSTFIWQKLPVGTIDAEGGPSRATGGFDVMRANCWTRRSWLAIRPICIGEGPVWQNRIRRSQ